MRKYGRGYRLVASGMGFFDQTRAQIDALIAVVDLRITEGDWPPQPLVAAPRAGGLR